MGLRLPGSHHWKRAGGAEGLRSKPCGPRVCACSQLRFAPEAEAGRGQTGRRCRTVRGAFTSLTTNAKGKGDDGGRVRSYSHSTLQSSFSLDLFLDSFWKEGGSACPSHQQRTLEVRGPIAGVQVDFRAEKGLG